MKITEASMQGPRDYMEDFSNRISFEDGGTMLAVFDGHGGKDTAEKCAWYLPEIAMKLNRKYYSFVDLTMTEVFRELNELTKEDDSGTTASVVYINPLRTRSISGILGDSPVFIVDSEFGFYLCPEHNARSNMAERIEAEQRGGYFNGHYMFNRREMDENPWKARGLQLTRALGNKHMGDVLSKKPHIAFNVLGPTSHIVVASDGFMDPGHMKDNTEKFEYIKRDIYLGNEACELLDLAASYGVKDNVTVLSANLAKD